MDPQQMHGYTYANNNPLSRYDRLQARPVQACYGREGCRQAYLCILHMDKRGEAADAETAKAIAANHCVYYAEECSDIVEEWARGNTIRDSFDAAFLAVLGGLVVADGTTKPIEDVKTGDKVLATDLATGQELRTLTGELVRITAVERRAQQATVMFRRRVESTCRRSRTSTRPTSAPTAAR